MSEYQIFCWSEKYGDELSKQQKDFRVFNKEVTRERYNEIISIIQKIIPNKNISLNEFWKQMTDEQIKKLSEIPEFDPVGFEYITGRKVEKSLSGTKVSVEIEGKKYTATID